MIFLKKQSQFQNIFTLDLQNCGAASAQCSQTLTPSLPIVNILQVEVFQDST